MISHANGATGLAAVVLCVEDPDEAAERYGGFTGLTWTAAGRARHLETARGTLVFIDRRTAEHTLGASAPALPWIAGYALDCRSVAAVRDTAAGAGTGVRDLADGRFAVTLPDALGGVIVFQAPERGVVRFE